RKETPEDPDQRIQGRRMRPRLRPVKPRVWRDALPGRFAAIDGGVVIGLPVVLAGAALEAESQTSFDAALPISNVDVVVGVAARYRIQERHEFRARHLDAHDFEILEFTLRQRNLGIEIRGELPDADVDGGDGR